ncbi:secretion system type I outer membrane efflux pump lipoprotein NodT [Swaminathania salitolerans LMG 21291]|uniref:Drug-resistance related outer-membrane protein n=2 Tax=Swaminathania salitolerans TaxID=182838 RepID=A0A511BMU8_9PROT|nr:secretion system type I outer membrane efflux pump lipoprotein NodT [Swaminathania salitolerans LMG 21291]GEL00974.1 drug-resistance related outer-membrane protein [Swaminathania salitolerans]
MPPFSLIWSHALNTGRSPRALMLCGASIAIALTLPGCVGPKYHKPDLWSPTQYDMHRRSGDVASQTTRDAPDPSWWKIFNDPVLTSLETRLATQNLDIQRATAQLAQSRAQLMMAGAERFPGLSASGSYARSQYSTKALQRILSGVAKDNSAALGAQRATLLDQSVGGATIPLLNQWKYSIDATYEIDLWGRVARQYEAAKADLQATNEERRGILIAQQADMANNYLTLRGLQEQLRITRANRDTQSRTLSLARERQKSGLVTALDVTSAESQLDSTTAQIAQLEQRIDQQINAISLLLGSPPGTLNEELTRSAGIPVVPPRVPIGVPSELARRRPDIRQAEAQLHAAVANVAEAEAEFYPKVTISADFGFQSLSFRDLGFWNARAWNVGPSISLPIFQGGRLRGQLMLNRYAQKAAAITYRQTVLGAWRDVDNALIAYRDEQKRRDGLQAAVDAAQRALHLSQDQYRSGLTTYLNVLAAQRDLLSAQLQLTDSTTSIASNLARLYNALGGGWEQQLPDSHPAESTVRQIGDGSAHHA